MKISDIFVVFNLLRIRQWAKNVFIFFPVLFSGRLFFPFILRDSLVAFTGFCLISSGMYILNDFLDQAKDRVHPRKCKRPIASGLIGSKTALGLMAVLILLGFGVCALVNNLVVYLALMYLSLHLMYNFFAKQIVIIDVIFLAFGFHIRIWVGAMAAAVLPSVWLQLCVFILALFLGFTKRRHEIAILKDEAVTHRDVLSQYNGYFLDQMIMICATLAIVFYGLYTISSDIVGRTGGHQMVYTILFVLYGIFRYLYLAHVKNRGGDPAEVLATDYPLLINVLAWILTAGYLIYG